MLGDVSRAGKIYIVTGYTDMRKSFDGLMVTISQTYQLDPYDRSLYLFCGRRSDRIKALFYDKDGFTMLYKRLDNASSRHQWPRSQDEVRQLDKQEFRWLLEGLAIDQTKAIKAGKKRES